MKVTLTRNILIEGKRAEAGTTVEVDTKTGRFLIGAKKATEETAEKTTGTTKGAAKAATSKVTAGADL